MSLDVLLQVLRGVPVTLFLTAAAFGLGAVIGVPLVVARISHRTALRLPARAVIELLRGIPPIVWLFLIYFGVADYVLIDATTAAVVGLAAISGAYLAEVYRGSLGAVSQGQWEAAKALGMSRLETVVRVIGPQVGRVSIPAAATYGIGLLKDTSVAFTIGVTEILYWANDQARVTNDSLGPYVLAAAVYVVLTVPCAWASRALDASLRTKVAAR
jgi:polar amino acid transport system permease protein